MEYGVLRLFKNHCLIKRSKPDLSVQFNRRLIK